VNCSGLGNAGWRAAHRLRSSGGKFLESSPANRTHQHAATKIFHVAAWTGPIIGVAVGFLLPLRQSFLGAARSK